MGMWEIFAAVVEASASSFIPLNHSTYGFYPVLIHTFINLQLVVALKLWRLQLSLQQSSLPVSVR